MKFEEQLFEIRSTIPKEDNRSSFKRRFTIEIRSNRVERATYQRQRGQKCYRTSSEMPRASNWRKKLTKTNCTNTRIDRSEEARWKSEREATDSCRTCWLLTETTSTEQKFTIGLPAHLSRTGWRVWKKQPYSLHDLERVDETRRYFLSAANKYFPPNESTDSRSDHSLFLTLIVFLFAVEWFDRIARNYGFHVEFRVVATAATSFLQRANSALCTENMITVRSKENARNAFTLTLTLISIDHINT